MLCEMIKVGILVINSGKREDSNLRWITTHLLSKLAKFIIQLPFNIALSSQEFQTLQVMS
jgi:hypothetical protein